MSEVQDNIPKSPITGGEVFDEAFKKMLTRSFELAGVGGENIGNFTLLNIQRKDGQDYFAMVSKTAKINEQAPLFVCILDNQFDTRDKSFRYASQIDNRSLIFDNFYIPLQANIETLEEENRLIYDLSIDDDDKKKHNFKFLFDKANGNFSILSIDGVESQSISSDNITNCELIIKSFLNYRSVYFMLYCKQDCRFGIPSSLSNILSGIESIASIQQDVVNTQINNFYLVNLDEYKEDDSVESLLEKLNLQGDSGICFIKFCSNDHDSVGLIDLSENPKKIYAFDQNYSHFIDEYRDSFLSKLLQSGQLELLNIPLYKRERGLELTEDIGSAGFFQKGGTCAGWVAAFQASVRSFLKNIPQKDRTINKIKENFDSILIDTCLKTSEMYDDPAIILKDVRKNAAPLFHSFQVGDKKLYFRNEDQQKVGKNSNSVNLGFLNDYAIFRERTKGFSMQKT